MNITNNSPSPLGIPGVGTIEPGASKDAPASIKNNAVVAAWLAAGMLVEAGDSAAPVTADDDSGDAQDHAQLDDDEDGQKTALIAALAERGIHKTRRSSVKTLREALDDADG